MISLLGISYKSADIEIRERFTFSKEEIADFTKTLFDIGNINALVILSTCNRSEIYYHTNTENHPTALRDILELLAKTKAYTDELKPNFYFKDNIKAVRHLFKVVSGIDSIIVGEDQVIGQVKEAFRFAEEIQSTNKILKRLFTKSFEVGKKVRSETQINRGSASASSAAVNLCHQNFPDLSQQHLMLIGAGQTGQLVLNSLRKATVGSLKVANRTFSKATEVAKLFGGESIQLEEVDEHLPASDIVFIATDSPTPLVKLEEVKEVLKKRNNRRKTLYFDLSVPRNIENGVADLDGVTLFTIDDLQDIVKSTNENRMKEIEAAMSIIHRAEDNFMSWKHEQELVPTIIKIKNNFQQLNHSEMEEFMKIRSIKENELLNEYADHITEKFARVFIKNLKSLSKTSENRDLLEMAEELFEL